jgi:Glycosyltransferase family 87
LDDLYGSARAGSAGAYLYAPPFAQLLAPFKALPWAVFAGLWLLLLAMCLVALGGPWAILIALIPPVLIELQAGNIHLLLALAIGLGLRYPTSWAFVLLTKPTLGIGLLWFLVRREWRPLAIALASTAIVGAVSFVVAPAAWAEWAQVLLANARHPISSDYSGVIHIPLLIRLPIAALVVIWGARSDRSWTIALATMLALPILWVNGLAVLLAAPMLIGTEQIRTRIEVLRSGGGRYLRAGGRGHQLAVREESDALGE